MNQDKSPAAIRPRPPRPGTARPLSRQLLESPCPSVAGPWKESPDAAAGLEWLGSDVTPLGVRLHGLRGQGRGRTSAATPAHQASLPLTPLRLRPSREAPEPEERR